MVRRPRPSHLLRNGSVVALALVACNQILGIDEAHVDPSLANGGAASHGGKSAQGGDQIEAGSSSLPPASGGKAAGGAPANDGGTATNGGSAAGEAGTPIAEGGATRTSSGGATPVDSAGAGAGGAGAGGDVGSAGAPPVSLCADYCDQITQYCLDDSLQYKDHAQCMTVCQSFPNGATGDDDTDTVACRLKYAMKARYAGGSELEGYCREAGPGGNGRCGGNCEGLCDIAMTTCTPAATDPYFFTSRSACLNTCNGLPQINFTYGADSSADGNSVQCRLFHAMSAAMSDPEEHCSHVMGITLCETSSEH